MTAAHPRRVEGVSGKDLGGEYVLYDSTGDQVHVLNATAKEIFLLCDGSRSVEEVAHALAQRFEGVDVETARRDVAAMVEQLYGLGVLSDS